MPISTNLARIVYRLTVQPEGWPVASLCEELGIGDRTYRKYRALLRDLEPFQGKQATHEVVQVDVRGVPTLKLRKRDDVLRVEQQDFAGRIAAAHLMREVVRLLDGTEIGDGARTWWDAFCANANDPEFIFGEFVADLDRMFLAIPHAPKDFRPHAGVLRDALQAVLYRRPVRLDYAAAHDADGQLSHPEIHPYSLLLHDSALYLVGRDRVDHAIKLYAIERIAVIARIPDVARFDYPTRADYDPETKFGGGFGIYRTPNATKRDVVLEIENLPWLQRDLRERTWETSQQFEELPDGRLRMRFETDALVDVAHWLFGRSPFVTMIEPSPDEWQRILEQATRR